MNERATPFEKFDIENSTEKPILAQFEQMKPLTKFDGEPIKINYLGNDYTVRAVKYGANHGANLQFERYLLLLSDQEDTTGIGYAEMESNMGSDPVYSGCHIVNYENLGKLNDPTFDKEKVLSLIKPISNHTLAMFVDPNNRGQGVGELLHTTMLALMQNEGFETYSISGDATNTYKVDHADGTSHHSGMNINEFLDKPIDLDLLKNYKDYGSVYSFYTRHSTDTRQQQYEHPTSLSSRQIHTLREAFEY